MPQYTIEMILTIAGIGAMQARNKPIQRLVIADTLAEAVAAAQLDILTVEITSAVKVAE